MKQKVNILVAGSGNVTGMNVIKALVEEDNVNVFGCDFDPINPSNKWCPTFEVPRCASSEYPIAILSLISKYNITHIIASNDHDVRSLAELKSKTEGFPYFNGYAENILACLDKKVTEKLFQNAGVQTPLEVTNKYDFPYVLRKEAMGNKKKFVHIVKSEEDIIGIPQEHYENGIMTRFVEGIEYTVDILCDSNSNMLSAIPRKRINVVGGMVHHAQIVKDEKLIALCAKLAKSVGLVGMSCIQCITDGVNYNFIEINPRPGSGIDLSINSGVNMPLLWLKETIGEEYSLNEPQWGMQMKRYYSGYYF